jgi:hypothetical protein
VGRPIGGEEHRHEVAAGGMPADDNPLGVRAVPVALARDPRDGATAFVDDRRDGHGRAKIVVDHRHRVAARDERPRDEREIALVERAPVAAVQEHERPA